MHRAGTGKSNHQCSQQCRPVECDGDIAVRHVVVLYCTLLAQAQSDADRQKVVRQMESDGELVKILRQLQETEKEDIVHEERERRQAARKSRVEMDLDTMDTDDAGVITDRHYLNNYQHWPSIVCVCMLVCMSVCHTQCRLALCHCRSRLCVVYKI